MNKLISYLLTILFQDRCIGPWDCATWYGGNDIALETVYTWITSGTAVSYTNWNREEPNGGQRENCINVYYNGVWNDAPCNLGISKFVCEI